MLQRLCGVFLCHKALAFLRAGGALWNGLVDAGRHLGDNACQQLVCRQARPCHRPRLRGIRAHGGRGAAHHHPGARHLRLAGGLPCAGGAGGRFDLARSVAHPRAPLSNGAHPPWRGGGGGGARGPDRPFAGTGAQNTGVLDAHRRFLVSLRRGDGYVDPPFSPTSAIPPPRQPRS